MIGGKLPDGESFSSSGSVASGGTDNQISINKALSYPFAVTKGQKGLLAGTLMFIATGTSDLSGTLTWVKPAQKRGAYKDPINTTLLAVGSLYFPPGNGGSVLTGFDSGTLEFSDTAALSISGTSQLDEAVSLNYENQLSFTNPVAGERVTAKITPSTGVFKGTFIYPKSNTRKATRTTYSGVLLQDQLFGGGYFMGPNGGGTVSLSSP